MTKNEALVKVAEANTDLLFAIEKIIDAQNELIESLAAPNQYISAQDYAKRFGISVTTVYRKVRQNEIPGKFIGRRCVVEEPAQYHLSASQVYKQLNAGVLKGHQVGSKWIVEDK